MNTKADFVKALEMFYQSQISTGEFYRLDYREENNNEFVYVSYVGGAQKRFYVNGDNTRGILMDFMQFLNHSNMYEWLKPEEIIDFEKGE